MSILTRKNKMITIIIFGMIFCGVFSDAYAYNDRPVTVQNQYDAWYHCTRIWGIRPLGTGYVSVVHRVGMTAGAENVEVCDPINFAYTPDNIFFLDNSDGVWDTPYGEWCSTIDGCVSKGTVVSKGQSVNSLYLSIHTPSKPGYVYWSAVKPAVTLSSSNNAIVRCEGMNCEAVGVGQAVITAQIPQTQARMWGVIYGSEAQYWSDYGYPFAQGGVYVQHNPGYHDCDLVSVSGQNGNDHALLTLPNASVSWTINVSPDSSGICTKHDGRCNPLTDGIVTVAAPTKDLCCDPTISDQCITADGYAQPKPPHNNGDGTWSWSCAGTYGGTIDQCATVNRAICGAAGDGVNDLTNTKPQTSLLCGTGSVSTEVHLNETNGMWEWDCVNNNAQDGQKIVHCAAPTCLTNLPIDLQRYVYFDTDGNPNQATINVYCSGANVCCSIDGQNISIEGEQKNFICTGQSGEISVNGGGQLFDARCWFDDGDDEPKVQYNDLPVGTMCTARSCNGQGSCQSTPQIATDITDCTNSCNSDADCSSGRMIETRP